MLTIETDKPHEEPEMRKVRNHSAQTGNPAMMFASGVESLVSERLERPRYAEDDRKQEAMRKTMKVEPRGNLFSLLMRQFASS